MQIQALSSYITVEIDLKKREEKPFIGKYKDIIVPDAFQYMVYNLQYGTILSVGNEVENEEIKPGRIAIFHHMVESKQNHLLYRSETSKKEIRQINTESLGLNFQLFAVINEDGEIISMPMHVFCEPQEFDSNIEEMQLQFDGHPNFLAKAKQTSSGLFVVEKEVNELDVALLYCKVTNPPYGNKELKKGDIITADAAARYPLDIFDKTYWLFNMYFVYSKIVTN